MDRIPKISDRKLLRRMKKLTPLICKKKPYKWSKDYEPYMQPHYYKLEFEESIGFMRQVAFTFDPKCGEKIWPFNIDPIINAPRSNTPNTIITFHKYGAPSFFKPSIAEVVAQLPEDFNGAFCIETDDLNVYHCLDDGYHFTKTYLWDIIEPADEEELTNASDELHQNRT